MFKDKLSQIKNCLNNINAPVLNYLKESIPIKEMEVVINQFMSIKQIPEEVILLYLWHNGTRTFQGIPAENFYLFPTYFLNSVEDIKLLLEENSLLFIEKKMLPIFSSGRGEYLTIDLKSKEKSKIFCAEPWNSDSGSDIYTDIYDNFDTMFDTIINCFKNKIYYISNDGLLSMDFDKAWEIAKIMNPNSQYWKQ
jgi:hypothetical protein